jgi:hypothetical protein
MIAQTLKILINELNGFLGSFADLELSSVLGNFADVNSDDQNFSEKIVLTLIRIEEENTLKNTPNTKTVGNQSYKSNPIVFLNIYIIFISNYKNYEKALTGLSYIIKFFQGKYHFNNQNSNVNQAVETEGDLNLWMNIYTPSIEEINHIWSLLGGKLYPSVMYKVKMIAEARPNVISSTTLVTAIENKFRKS